MTRPDIEGIKLRALLMEGSHYANSIMALLAYIEELEARYHGAGAVARVAAALESAAPYAPSNVSSRMWLNLAKAALATLEEAS